MTTESVSNATVPQERPTPKPQQMNFVFLFSILFFSCVTMVSGMDADYVFPKCDMLLGAFSSPIFSFLTIASFIFMLA